MSKVVLVVGTCGSRTHYTSTLLFNHDEIVGPISNIEDSYAEFTPVQKVMTQEEFDRLFNKTFDNYNKEKVIVLNNHSWLWYLDYIRNVVDDLYVVYCFKDFIKWYNRQIVKNIRKLQLNPFYTVAFRPTFVEGLHKEKRKELNDQVFIRKSNAEVTAEYYTDTIKFAKHYDVDYVLGDSNYKEGIIEIQKDIGITPLSINEIADKENVYIHPLMLNKGYDLYWNKETYTDSLKLDGVVNLLLKRKEIQDYIKEISMLNLGLGKRK